MRCRGRLSRSFALQPGSTLKLSYSKTRCLCAKTAGFILTAKQTTTLDYHLSVCFSYFDLIPNEKLIVKLRGRNVFTLRGQEESFCYNSTDARGDLELRLKVKKLCPYDGIANAAAGFRLTVRSIEGEFGVAAPMMTLVCILSGMRFWWLVIPVHLKHHVNY